MLLWLHPASEKKAREIPGLLLLIPLKLDHQNGSEASDRGLAVQPCVGNCKPAT